MKELIFRDAQQKRNVKGWLVGCLMIVIALSNGCTANPQGKRTTKKQSILSQESFAVKKEKLPEHKEFNAGEFYKNIIIVYSEKDRGTLTAAKEIAADIRKKRDVKAAIVSDNEITRQGLENSNLIIIGNTTNNKILKEMESELPAVADGAEVLVGKGDKVKKHRGNEYGVTYIYPNLYNKNYNCFLVIGNSEAAYKIYDFGKADMMVHSSKIVSPFFSVEKEFVNFNDKWEIENITEVSQNSGENDVLEVGEGKAYPFPEWARGKVMYEIFVRSFCDSDGDGIGDLKGVISKLDYIQELGIDIIWMMPIFQSPSYHGYDTSDYFKINKEYGTNEDFRELSKEAHNRGMKILLDVPFNQASKDEPHFRDAYGNPNSKYDRWFYFYNLKNTIYSDYAFKSVETAREVIDGTMPAWNTNNPEVVDFHVEAVKYWIDPNGDGDCSDGADGFRLDYARGPTHEYWRELYRKIKGVKADTLLIGEAWLSLDEVAKFFDRQFDAAYDFNLQGSMTTGLKGDIDTALSEEEKLLPSNKYLARFISNHDMDRFPTFKSVEELKVNTALIFSLAGIPTIYYGDEIGMKGYKEGDGDEGRRRPMEWYKNNKGNGMTNWYDPYDKNEDGISVEEQAGKSDSMLEYFKKISSVRKNIGEIIENSKREEIPVFELKEGKEINAKKVKSYLYNVNGKVVLVILNFGKEGEYIFDFSKVSAENITLVDLIENIDKIDIKKEKVMKHLGKVKAYIMKNINDEEMN